MTGNDAERKSYVLTQKITRLLTQRVQLVSTRRGLNIGLCEIPDARFTKRALVPRNLR